MSIEKTIRVLDGFAKVPDGGVLSRGTVVQTNMTGNPNFPDPPVNLADLKAAIGRFSALIAEALDRSKKVIAEKTKQREVVIDMLRLLARYVEVTCDGDMAKFQTSGFQPASATKPQTPPLSENVRKIRHGLNSGQVVVQLKAVPEAYSYELRYAPLGSGGTPGTWTTMPLVTVKSPITLNGLSPGTTYAFQVRWLGRAGYCDWSDSVTWMCT